MVVMKNWSVCKRDNGFLAPELWVGYLAGNVYGHHRFNDGDLVDTTRIIDVKEEYNHKIVSTKNTEYIIYKCDVNPEYERYYPNAYDRLSIAIAN